MRVEVFEARLRLLPCVVCVHKGLVKPTERGYGTVLHHAGQATDRDDWNQVPLCELHHTGPEGVHGLHRREFERRHNLTEMKLLALTRRAYAMEYE